MSVIHFWSYILIMCCWAKDQFFNTFQNFKLGIFFEVGGEITDSFMYISSKRVQHVVHNVMVRHLIFHFSIIAQVIIEMCMLWLVEDCIISFYNHPARGDYNTEALIFKMATAWFLDVFEEETNKMKENAIALIITWVSSYTKTIEGVCGIRS